MLRSQVDGLDARQCHWVIAVAAPSRNWSAAPGCRAHARFLVDVGTMRPSRDEFGTFDTQLSCLSWIMRNRAQLNRTLPGASVRPVPLDRWLLGLE
jgi:hypothetical protein